MLEQSGAVGVLHVDRLRGFDVVGCLDDLVAQIATLRWIVSFGAWDEFLTSGAGVDVAAASVMVRAMVEAYERQPRVSVPFSA